MAKLENLANNDLVLIEKLETKEVYGKKGKIENIKETVVIEEKSKEEWQKIVEVEKFRVRTLE